VVRVLATDREVPRLDSRNYHIFCEVVGLERGSLSLVNAIEEIPEGKSGASVWKAENAIVGIRCADNAAPSTRNI
jgi:hypothetical protein